MCSFTTYIQVQGINNSINIGAVVPLDHKNITAPEGTSTEANNGVFILENLYATLKSCPSKNLLSIWYIVFSSKIEMFAICNMRKRSWK